MHHICRSVTLWSPASDEYMLDFRVLRRYLDICERSLDRWSRSVLFWEPLCTFASPTQPRVVSIVFPRICMHMSCMHTRASIYDSFSCRKEMTPRSPSWLLPRNLRQLSGIRRRVFVLLSYFDVCCSQYNLRLLGQVLDRIVSPTSQFTGAAGTSFFQRRHFHQKRSYQSR